MKLIKSFAIICVLVLSLVLLAGCGGGPTPPEPGFTKTIEEIKVDVLDAFDVYGNADNGSFKLIVKDGTEESIVDMTYNYDGGKVGIISLKSVLTNANGTLSVYITEGNAYTDRYGQSKTVVKVEGSQAEEIANYYSFNQFNEYLMLLLNNSFFDNATVESTEGTVISVSLNIGTYNIDNEEENEKLTTIFDGIKESNSVKLEVTYTEEVLTNIKVLIDKDGASSIELQLLGTAESEIEIAFPDFSGYTK